MPTMKIREGCLVIMPALATNRLRRILLLLLTTTRLHRVLLLLQVTTSRLRRIHVLLQVTLGTSMLKAPSPVLVELRTA